MPADAIASEKIKVVTSLSLLKELAERVGGEKVNCKICQE